jgi:hypothetical protein
MICLVIGAAIGQQFTQSVDTLMIGYSLAARAAFICLLLAENRKRQPEPVTEAS